VDAILMASGFSHRFGSENKLLQPFRGLPLALYTLKLVCRMPEFSRALFVAASGEVADLALGFPVTVIHNSAPERGLCESIRLGVQASDADYYCFLPCDQPLLDESVLRKLLRHAGPGTITEPVVDGKRRSPSVFSAVFRDELLSLPNEAGGARVKERHGEAVVTVEFGDARFFTDIDTLEDWKRLRQERRSGDEGASR
jgi:CTP:molybdopterin cytidylyltransferase MocA